VSKYKRAAENNARKADELETRFDKSKVETERLKTEVSEMKKQLVDARAHVADSKQFSKHYTTEIDLKAAKEELEQRLVQEIEVSTAEAEKLSQELKVLEKRTATKQLELEHIKQTAIADIEAVKLELVDREQEVIEVRHEATLAAKQAADIEETMERVVSDLKSEVMSATGNMEGAALAGLGLQEMLEKMRGDHTAAVEALEGSLGTVTEERDGLSVELADVIEKLEMRNAQLTKVMAFLQTQQADADEGEEVGEDGESLGLGAMLERTKKSKEALEAQLTDYEDENGRLSKDQGIYEVAVEQVGGGGARRR
jgi:chromosome segregation ATPase